MIFKLVLCIISVFLFLIFALPLISVKLNIGNTFGILFSITLFICGFFIENIFSKIILFIIILFLIIYTITLTKIIKAYHSKDTECDAVIILGCRVKGDKPSLALIERCKAGASYLSRHKSTIAILSGGQGDDELISEAECMKNLLIQFGIDNDRIILENKSTSTAENLTFSKKILDKLDKSISVAIVSSDYHLYRASMIAKDAGLDKITLIPSRTIWYCKPTFFTREVFGIWARILKIKE